MEEPEITQAIRDYIKSRLDTKLENHDKEAQKALSSLEPDTAAHSSLSAELKAKRLGLEKEYTPASWLDNAAKRAYQISMVTHALKYTHSDAKGTSLLYQGSPALAARPPITTDSIHNRDLDVVGNAATLDVASLLQLEAGDEQLVDQIKAGDLTALSPLAQDDAQLDSWMAGFAKALTDTEVSSHKLAKQVYFPVNDTEYHLLAPLFATSLTQALYNRMAYNRYSEQAVAARKARRDGTYHEEPVVAYPNTAVQNFGGTKPQNISQLNSRRRGQTILLPSFPPKWLSLKRLPTQNENAVWREFSRQVKNQTDYLCRFLSSVKDQNNVRIRRHRAQIVETLADELLAYGDQIQTQIDHVGWSEQSTLPRCEQLWLDPFREDSDFQDERQQNEWQRLIADKFAGWLNRTLRKKKIEVSDAEYHEWSSVLLTKMKAQQEVIA